jgi:hypothetical protein
MAFCRGLRPFHALAENIGEIATRQMRLFPLCSYAPGRNLRGGSPPPFPAPARKRSDLAEKRKVMKLMKQAAGRAGASNIFEGRVLTLKVLRAQMKLRRSGHRISAVPRKTPRGDRGNI